MVTQNQRAKNWPFFSITFHDFKITTTNIDPFKMLLYNYKLITFYVTIIDTSWYQVHNLQGKEMGEREHHQGDFHPTMEH